MEEPGFWDDPEQSTRMVRESKNLKDEVDTYRALEQQYEDIQVMIQMGYEENDSSLIPEIEEMLEQFKETLENMRMKLLLSGEYDSNNAILRLNAGAGGTESCDWCSILYRMYCRWAESKALRPMYWISWTARKRESNLSPCRLTVRMHTDICVLSTGCTVWCVYRPLIPRANARPPLCPATLCPILRRT